MDTINRKNHDAGEAARLEGALTALAAMIASQLAGAKKSGSPDQTIDLIDQVSFELKGLIRQAPASSTHPQTQAPEENL